MRQLLAGLLSITLLSCGSCPQRSKVTAPQQVMFGDRAAIALVRNALTAAARNDSAALSRLVKDRAAVTINGGADNPLTGKPYGQLTPSVLQLPAECSVLKIDATAPEDVIVDGTCVQRIKLPDGKVFNHSWPIGVDFHLSGGRIVSVNRRVYEW